MRNLFGRREEQVGHALGVVEEAHDGPEVGGVAADRAVRTHTDIVLEDRWRVGSVRRVNVHETARVFVREHAAERCRDAHAASDVRPESEHRRAGAHLQ